MNVAKFINDQVEAIEGVKNADALLKALANAGAGFGFDFGGIATIPNELKSFKQYAYIYRWPPGWFERYSARGYYNADPVIDRLRSSARPFAWHEAARDSTRDPLVMNEARDFNLKFGFTVPIHTLSGELASVTFGGGRFEMSAADRHALHMIAIYAHYKVVDLMGDRPPGLVSVALSPREREVLQWCSDGLPTRKIADRMSITENTVESHVANACVKLNARSRVQAVAIAMRSGLLK